jgi:hypothetical protein
MVPAKVATAARTAFGGVRATNNLSVTASRVTGVD